MYTDEILKEKYRVQNEMAQEYNYDLKKMAEAASKKLKELSRQFNVTIRYFNPLDISNAR